MKKMFSVYILLMIMLLSAVGCAMDPVVPVGFGDVNPSDDSTINPEDTITVNFDDAPANVKVYLGQVPLANQRVTWNSTGQRMTITGLFEPGKLKIEITWEEGSHELNYTVTVPEPPSLQENMVPIPPGEFQMGSDDPETGTDEKPVHPVHIDAFSMDQYEVTNKQYKQFIVANPSWRKDQIADNLHDGNYLQHWEGHNYPKGYDDHPVVYVSWYAAVAYTRWAGKRLPREAEWEKAARGGLSGKKYPWGDVIDSNKANYDGNIGETTPKGKYPRNKYRLYDMVGNVWEWCLDEYNEGFYNRSPLKNPLFGATSPNWIMSNFKGITSQRVLRGGSWASSPEYLRVALRARFDPREANCLTGFRCVK